MSKQLSEIPVSLLDLAPIHENETAGEAMQRSLKLAQAAESFGYKRDWFAEHHNMRNIASSATSVLIGYIANNTSKIRVGSGGVMLPNHAPLVIAEQFGTLAHLFPNRIDLGLGRAPGTDQMTSMALRRSRYGSVEEFPNDVEELQSYLAAPAPEAKIRATPGEGTEVPIWLLGSSTYSAQLAAMLGLPFSFAAHFAPTHLFDALSIYREKFQASKQLQSPYVMPCINVIAADTDEEAQRLATTFYQMALGLVRNDRRPLQPPADMSQIWNGMEEAMVKQRMKYTFIGSPSVIKKELQQLLEETAADEIMVTTYIYDLEAKIRSFEMVADLFKRS